MALIPTFPAVAAQLQYVKMQIWNGIIPQGGLQCLLATNNFAVNSAVTVDLTQQQQAGYLSNVQSVYIDASACSAPVTLQSGTGGGMNITIPGGWQGYFPFMQANPPKFILSSLGTGNVNVYFVNAPLPPIVWPSNGGTFKFDPSTGALLVEDAALDALIANGALNISLLPQSVSPFSEAIINFATSGDNVIVGAVASNIIRVYGLELLCAAAVALIFKDGAGNLFTAAQSFAANAGKILDRGNFPWYTCAVSQSFVINAGANVQVSGRVWYTQHV